MKLSMWMIANRLSEFSMDLNIREEAPAILRSARRVYSTNCVHVYQEGSHVVCAGEGDSIRIHNLSLAEGFEIIQGIFDFYEDWSEAMEQEIRARNYQRVVDIAWQVFQNPLLLMDGNSLTYGLLEPTDYTSALAVTLVLTAAAFLGAIPIFDRKKL